jgi:hypothetical protein
MTSCVPANTKFELGANQSSPVTGETLFKQAQPFLNCAYAMFLESWKKNKVYNDAVGDTACQACSSLLEPYKETLYERIKDEKFVNMEAEAVKAYAKNVMKSASK